MALGVNQQRAQSMQTVQISLHISQFHHICTCKSNVWLFNDVLCLFRFITCIVGTTTAELRAEGSHSNKKNDAENSKAQHAGDKSHQVHGWILFREKRFTFISWRFWNVWTWNYSLCAVKLGSDGHRNSTVCTEVRLSSRHGSAEERENPLTLLCGFTAWAARVFYSGFQ